MANFDFIEGYYNPCQRHSTLGYLSPAQYEHIAWDGANQTTRNSTAVRIACPKPAGAVPNIASSDAQCITLCCPRSKHDEQRGKAAIR